MSDTIIRRYVGQGVESREEDGTRRISGHAAVFYDGTPDTEFDVWGIYTERIMPGAFDDALKDSDVRALFNHDPNQILGRSSAGTLVLSTDDIGLQYSVDLPDTQIGRDVWESVARGDIQGNSFSFRVEEETAAVSDDGRAVREITKVQPLFDVGPVTFPAYESTDVQARSIEDARKWQDDHKIVAASRTHKRRLRLELDAR